MKFVKSKIMTYNIVFSVNEKIQIFKDVGLSVQIEDMPFNFSKDPQHPNIENVPVWTVINPHTGKPELVNDLFDKYIKSKVKTIILECDKLEIFKLFTHEN